MTDFYFDKSYFGTPFYLFCWEDGEVAPVTDQPREDALCIGSLEAWVVSKLYGINIPRFPPLRYRRFFKDEKEPIPWNHVMPQHAYRKEVKRIVDSMRAEFCDLDLTYYHKYFKGQNQIFEDLRPAKIDVELLVKMLASHEDAQGHLKSFMPEQGYAQVPKYSRIATKTGRLKVKKGPMILNLKKEHRKILTSRFEGGSIWQLDYSSLEPRILLAANDNEDIPEDVYQAVIDSFGLTNVPRAAIKTALISRIFGAGGNTIEKQLEDLVNYPADVLNMVDEYFGIAEMRERLVSEFTKNGGSFITNHYGRRILCEDSPQYVLLNYFVQSTGVDICLFGFNQVVAKLKEASILDRIVPLYILHDALFLDVHPDLEYLLPKLCKVGSMDIPKFENTNFYLREEKEV